MFFKAKKYEYIYNVKNISADHFIIGLSKVEALVCSRREQNRISLPFKHTSFTCPNRYDHVKEIEDFTFKSGDIQSWSFNVKSDKALQIFLIKCVIKSYLICQGMVRVWFSNKWHLNMHSNQILVLTEHKNLIFSTVLILKFIAEILILPHSQVIQQMYLVNWDNP